MTAPTSESSVMTTLTTISSLGVLKRPFGSMTSIEGGWVSEKITRGSETFLPLRFSASTVSGLLPSFNPTAPLKRYTLRSARRIALPEILTSSNDSRDSTVRSSCTLLVATLATPEELNDGS